MLTILPFAIIEKVNYIYQDSRLYKLSFLTNKNQLLGIHTTENRANFVNKMDKEYNYLIKNNYAVFFYGNKSHLFNFLYPKYNLKIADFHQTVDNDLYANKIIIETNKYKKNVAVFIVDHYPRTDGDDFDVSSSIVVNKLIKNNFTPIVKDDFVYYIK